MLNIKFAVKSQNIFLKSCDTPDGIMTISHYYRQKMVTPDLDALVIPGDGWAVVQARAQAAASVFGFLLLHRAGV